MAQKKFVDYEEYKRAQIAGSKRRNNRRAGCNKREIREISNWFEEATGVAQAILCHGARCGREIDWFQQEWPDAEITGTDLNPIGEKIRKWDFNEPLETWSEYFDIVYSNSLDHSPDPLQTLKVWLSQVAEGGCLFLRWSPGHILPRLRRGRSYPGGDCYGAHVHEYCELAVAAGGYVSDMIYVPSKRGPTKFSLNLCIERLSSE